MKFSNSFKSKVLTVGLVASVFLVPISASAQIFGGPGGNTLLGAGIGAGLGGVLGSNLAGSGVQQEGTAIGAVLGGIAGAAIANRGANRGVNRRVNRGSSRYGGYVPGFGPGYGYEYSGQRRNYRGRASVPYSTFGGSYVNEYSTYNRQFIQPMPLQGLQYIQDPSFVQNYTIPHVTEQVYHPPVQQQITRHVYAPARHITRTIIHHQPTVTRTVHVVRPEPVNIVEHQYAEPSPAPITHVLPAPTNVYCYAESNKRYTAQGRLIKGNAGGAKTCLLNAYEGR